VTPATLAARDGAVLLDLTGRTLLELTGRDRVPFLHNFCTNDIKALAPGQGCEAFLCNAKGRVLSHVTVFADADSLWLETVAGQAARLRSHLERYIIREDVALHDRSAEVAEVLLTGPRSRELFLEACTPAVADGLREKLSAMPRPGIIAWDRAPWLRVGSVAWLTGSAWLVWGSVAGPAVKDLVAQLIARGGVRGDADDWESLRIDAGFPEYGHDITDDRLPQEVARNRLCLNFHKGCYLGQEPIARLDALGHTNQELRRLRGTGRKIPSRGTRLHDRDSGAEAGIVTSAATHPFEEGVVALGYVKRKWFAAGTVLSWEEGELTVRP